MILLVTDLDNTLIYSRRRDIGNDKEPVEKYQGEYISYMTKYTYDMFDKVVSKVQLVPLTTRSTEQYKRICFPNNYSPAFALTGNGGTLLYNGKEDDKWSRMTQAMLLPYQDIFNVLEEAMWNDRDRSLDVKKVNGHFLYTKSDRPESTVKRLEEIVRSADLCDEIGVYRNNLKVYVLPRCIDKAEGLKRLRERLKPELTIAAGDSVFDINMLKEADIAFAAPAIADKVGKAGKLVYAPKDSEELSDIIIDFFV